MEEKNIPMVSVASIEVLVAHYVRIIKWLIVALILSICLLFSTVAIPYISPDEEIVDQQNIEAEQDGNGTNIVGGGNISYGTEGTNPKD